MQYNKRVVYHCRIKNLNRGEIGGLNDELQNKRLIISDKDIVFEPQADHQKKSQKATIKRQVLQNQYFVGLFLLPFGDLDRQKEGST